MADPANRVSYAKVRSLYEQDYDSLLRESSLFFGTEGHLRGGYMSVQEGTPGNGSLDGLEQPGSPVPVQRSRSRYVFRMLFEKFSR